MGVGLVARGTHLAVAEGRSETPRTQIALLGYLVRVVARFQDGRRGGVTAWGESYGKGEGEG